MWNLLGHKSEGGNMFDSSQYCSQKRIPRASAAREWCFPPPLLAPVAQSFNTSELGNKVSNGSPRNFENSWKFKEDGRHANSYNTPQVSRESIHILEPVNPTKPIISTEHRRRKNGRKWCGQTQDVRTRPPNLFTILDTINSLPMKYVYTRVRQPGHKSKRVFMLSCNVTWKKRMITPRTE